MNLNTFQTDHSLHLIKLLGNFTLTPKVGVETGRDHLNSKIHLENAGGSRVAGEEYLNDLYMRRSLFYIDAGLQSNRRPGVSAFSCRLTCTGSTLLMIFWQVKKSYNRFVPEPSVNASYDVSAFWKASFSANLKKSFGNIDQLYTGFILGDYRSFQAFNSTLPEHLVQNIICSSGMVTGKI